MVNINEIKFSRLSYKEQKIFDIFSSIIIHTDKHISDWIFFTYENIIILKYKKSSKCLYIASRSIVMRDELPYENFGIYYSLIVSTFQCFFDYPVNTRSFMSVENELHKILLI